MNTNKKLIHFLASTLIVLLILNCGGGGGGTTSVDNTPSNNGFIANSENKIGGGQKEFAFGQTATFNSFDGSEVNSTWASNNGSIDSAGQYYTPKDLSETTDDTISLTTSGENYSRIISLSPFPKLEEGYFKYSEGNQKYAIKDLNTSQSIAVATFKNNSTSKNEGNIKIKNLNVLANKIGSESLFKSDGFGAQLQLHKDAKCLNLSDPIKFSQRKAPKLNKSNKSNRAADPLGTRDSFFHDESIKGFKAFEKIYSGDKCLIYSEINPSTDQPFVSQTRGKFMGDAFEISNPYHPNGNGIYEIVTKNFGHPWGIDENGNEINNGRRDGEKQVIFLIYNTSNTTYGYFYWVDEEEKGFVNPADGYISNGAEIVYLNQQYASDDIAILSTMAHEFQHLCDYNQRFALNGSFANQNINERIDAEASILFNEGQSLLSEDLNGFPMNMPNNKGNDFIFQVVNNYQSTISTFSKSFLSWSGGSDYGKGYLFMRYIYDTYGESALKEISRSQLIQPNNMTSITDKNFDELLQEFLLALIQTDSSQALQSNLKLTIINRDLVYFDTKGKAIGKFSPFDYVNGFNGDVSKQIPANVIKSEKPYEIRVYKLLPNNGKVEFTLENIKGLSNYSIFPSIINK